MAQKPKTEATDSQDDAKYWLEEIKSAEESLSTWTERAKKVVDRYRDDRGIRDVSRRKFNILWSNVQVLKPALYGRMPKPEVSRRYLDQDPVGRVASMILERCLEYEVEEYPDFAASMNGVVEDRLLPGRGTAWIRYEPHIEQEDQVSEDVDAQLESLEYECAPCDYVNWQDFLHNPARTWDEVWWVARRVWMTKEEGVQRFGALFRSVPIDNKKDISDKETPKDALKKKAQVWEIWDKTEKKVIWVAKGFPKTLDEKPDPLQLESFFPCPKPLYATTTTGSLIPIPDYCEYQDQAEELDLLTQRIALLAKALKVRGVYNAEFKSIKRLLTETEDNELIPVDSWAAFAEKGGLKGAVDWLPLDVVAGVLEKLYVAREQVLQVIYQTIGLSDIMRGSTDADETLGAQKLKANFGSMRLRSTQGDTAMFATELLRLKAEVMCGFFSPETMVKMSGVEQAQEVKENPELLQAALELLKSRKIRQFRINIESDTLAQIDESAEKQEVAEYIASMGEILKGALPVVQAAPPMLTFVGEVMLLATRKQRAGRTVENKLEQALKATEQLMSQPQGIPPQIQEQIQQKEQELQQAGQEVQKGMQEVQSGKEQLQKGAQDLQKRSADLDVREVKHQANEQVFALKQQHAGKEQQMTQEQSKMAQDMTNREALMQAKELIAKYQQGVGALIHEAETKNKAEQQVNQAKNQAEGKKQETDKSEARITSVMEKVLKMNADLGQQLGDVMKVLASDKELYVDQKTGNKRVRVVNA